MINSYGSYLRSDHGSFLIINEDKKQKVSPRNIKSILVTTGAAISTDAIQLALEKNIEIQFLNKYGDSIGKIWHTKLGSTTYIRRRQLEISDNEEGTEFIQTLMAQKVQNCIDHLNDLGKKRGKEKKQYIEQVTEELAQLKIKLNNVEGKVENIRSKLMGYEGNAAKKYFATLSYLLPDRYRFEGRSSRPARDEFNCLLNYGYGVLYSRIEKACIIAGLDPYVGILHTDGYNKKSFVFDIIEPFRVYIDRLVMRLFAAKTVNKNYFDAIRNGVTLNEEGKKYFIQNLNEYFAQRVRYNSRDIQIMDIFQFECHQLANRLIGED